jgi:hypothetical protein
MRTTSRRSNQRTPTTITVRANPKAIMPRLVIDRPGEETVRELIEARRTGVKLRELVEPCETSESSLKRLFRYSEQPRTIPSPPIKALPPNLLR